MWFKGKAVGEGERAREGKAWLNPKLDLELLKQLFGTCMVMLVVVAVVISWFENTAIFSSTFISSWKFLLKISGAVLLEVRFL